MQSYKFPCPVCCKHIEIKVDDWKKGGVFTCRKCGNKIRLRPHPVSPDADKVSK